MRNYINTVIQLDLWPIIKSLHRNFLIPIITFTAISCYTIPFANESGQNVIYDPVLSQKYVTYASIAFCPKACVQSWTCINGAKYPKLVNVTYLQNTISKAVGYIGYDPATQTMVTSWRGSSNPQNDFEDIVFIMQPYSACSNCFIHTGFYYDYKSNEKKLLAAANAITRFYKVSKILCTGHSLGAAISLINGIEFVQKFPGIPVEVHNFGQPRVGNHKLAEYMMSKISTIFRVVHNRDIVPHLPPEVDYHHPAYEVFFDADMKNYKVCSISGEDSTCSNKFFPAYNPNDHDLYFIKVSQTKC